MKLRYGKGEDLDFLVAGRRNIRAAEKRLDVETGLKDREELEEALGRREIRVAEESGEAVAFIWFRPSFRVMHVDDFLWVHLVYVKEELRAKGVGRLLYEDAAEIARSMGKGKIVIDVFEANRNSIEFHKRVGFEPLYTIYQKIL